MARILQDKRAVVESARAAPVERFARFAAAQADGQAAKSNDPGRRLSSRAI